MHQFLAWPGWAGPEDFAATPQRMEGGPEGQQKPRPLKWLQQLQLPATSRIQAQILKMHLKNSHCQTNVSYYLECLVIFEIGSV